MFDFYALTEHTLVLYIIRTPIKRTSIISRSSVARFSINRCQRLYLKIKSYWTN